MLKKAKLFLILLLPIPLLTNCDFTVGQEYSVSFESNGGTHIATQRIKKNHVATRPTDPERDEDVFVDWYTEPEFLNSFNFETTKIVCDTTLYAKWEEESKFCHFTFEGTGCSISNHSHYEVDILKNSSVELVISPKQGYLLPTDDSAHFQIQLGSTQDISYEDTTGVITINNITSDIKIVAITASTNLFSFTFNGDHCQINNSYLYHDAYILSGSENLTFSILPDVGYMLPAKSEISIEGENVDYVNGLVTISKMTSNVKIAVTAILEEPYYSVNFSGTRCKAALTPEGKDASYSLITKRFESVSNIVIYLFPDDGFDLPDKISVIFDDGTGRDGDDYVYSKANRVVNIFKRGSVLIQDSEAKPTCTITFDAKDGCFFYDQGHRTLKLVVNRGTYIADVRHFFPIPNNVFGYVFGWYSYSNNLSAVEYNDVIDKDITLEATYFTYDKDPPFEDLDIVDWKIIKQVAVTNANPSICFKLGATKTVKVNGVDQKVRIIDFNKDVIHYNDPNVESTNLTAGFTFEFENLVSKSDGTCDNCYWHQKVNYNFLGSILNNHLNTDDDCIFSLLPKELRDLILTVNKNVATNQSQTPNVSDYELTSYSTKLFPLAHDEMTVHEDCVFPGEGSLYEYYRVHNQPDDRAKKDLQGSQLYYWLRSPYLKDDLEHFETFVWQTKGDGSIDKFNNYELAAFAPAFCI